jgi:hypothetical protein
VAWVLFQVLGLEFLEEEGYPSSSRSLHVEEKMLAAAEEKEIEYFHS